MASNAGHDGEISDEARIMAARVRDRAARLPDAAEIAELAMTPGADMSPDEIRQLGINAVAQAAQVAFLLGKLAALMDDPAGSPGG